MALARKEAERFHHNSIGTEHVLLGLIALGQGTAVAALNRMGVNLDTVRTEIEKMVGTGPDERFAGNFPYTPRAKKVLALAAKQAKELNHTYVGTEHILLGLLAEGDGVAARVLRHLNLDVETTRENVLQELDPNYRPGAAAGAGSATTSTVRRPEVPPIGPSPPPQHDAVDINRRYDVYCKEQGEGIVVYRNARFKGTKLLLKVHQYDVVSGFLELEQDDGQTIFVARSSVVKFCEPGVKPGSVKVPDQQA